MHWTSKRLGSLRNLVVVQPRSYYIYKTTRVTTSACDTLEFGGAEEPNDTWTFYDLGEDW